MSTINNLNELFIDQLRDVYNAEQQLTKALPKMVQAATSADLRAAFDSHLQETFGHVSRLEAIFQTLGESEKGKTCYAMKGLVEEGSEAIKEKGPNSVHDAALIAAAQRVEHYEMAAYGTLRAYAEMLGFHEAVQLLESTLREEKAADQKLNDLAQSHINQEALTGASAS